MKMSLAARQSVLVAQATTVFESDEPTAKRWLSSPQIGLGGAVPVDLAKTAVGYREVEKLLTRIDRGVYA
jgi:putative toxin-antitoxin system antitoxin component (TIGR02293 family)